MRTALVSAARQWAPARCGDLRPTGDLMPTGDLWPTEEEEEEKADHMEKKLENMTEHVTKPFYLINRLFSLVNIC